MTALAWQRSVDGYVESVDGRFRIEPLFNGGTRPYAYRLVDAREPERRRVGYSQRECKDRAARLVRSAS